MILGLYSFVSKEENKKARLLEMVQAYADAMIEKGRDNYGDLQSPLFAAALDRFGMTLGSIENFSEIQGVRKSDRSLGGANPQEDRSLYAILYELTEITADENELQKPDAFAKVVEHMINTYQLTGAEKYLRRADYFAWLGIDLFLADGNPLPMATNQHDHYEAITGGPDFMYALLHLYQKY
ncbi:hypothetical protein [Cyclobacterium plantarum]|uniref:Uncharacterized protein n=1 Tax=Cyclobacterium plantarum TaxID=2716263 RepID=A0ABX0HE32_9BACT|nr:hypothetical protein [Cyclobacterium plantarum]NHE59575.1 hypothetical protein [Cyclobacterium plantarum]